MSNNELKKAKTFQWKFHRRKTLGFDKDLPLGFFRDRLIVSPLFVWSTVGIKKVLLIVSSPRSEWGKVAVFEQRAAFNFKTIITI